MSKSKSTSGGVSTLSLLGVAFIILKLCHVIDWSWWWVTCPFWGGIAIVLAVLAAIGLFALVALIVAAIAACFVK